MLNTIILFAFENTESLQEESNGGLDWWVILLLLAIVTIVVIWALTRNAEFSESDAPHVDHAHAERVETAVVEEPAYVEPSPPAAPEPAPVSFSPDNLIVIEGIGPKIAAVLNAAGIQTFGQLADTEPEAIRQILYEADPRLARLGNPSTWPAQAKLAAAGDMAGLQALQDTLKGGRENI